MQKIVLLTTLLIVIGPADLPAYRDYRPVGKVLNTIPPGYAFASGMRSRYKPHHQPPVKPGFLGKPAHPIHPAIKPGRPGHGPRPHWWPASTTIVRDVQPIIIVNTPASAKPTPPPQPEKIWVPPVMTTRTEPGFWDYGVKKRWMGDHWRYEQDFDERNWVPEAEVRYVKQEGYWKTVE